MSKSTTASKPDTTPNNPGHWAGNDRSAVKWVEQLLKGQCYYPSNRGDTTPVEYLREFAKTLTPAYRARLDGAALYILRSINFSRAPKNEYAQQVFQLAAALELQDAIPILDKTARKIKKSRNRFNWETCNIILFSLQNLKAVRPADFWMKIFNRNPSEFGAATISALLDIDLHTGVAFISQLPNDDNLGDVVALNLDYHCDILTKARQEEFKLWAATAAKASQPKIKRAVKTWLEETKPETKPAQKLNPKTKSKLKKALGFPK